MRGMDDRAIAEDDGPPTIGAEARQRPASALRSAALSQVGRQLIQLATIALLARLVLPSEFGLVSMAALIVGLLALFRDLGTASALIQRPDLTQRLVSTIFWLNVAIGALIAAGLWLLAPWVAAFFGEPRVEPLLRVMSVTPLISSLGLAHQALLEREMRFERLLRVEMTSVFSAAVVGIGLALAGAGAWSLVGQSLVQTSVSVGGLWIASGLRPSPVFSRDDVRSVARFSLGVTGAMLFNYVARNADYVLIGRFLGAEQLGYYTIAYRIMLYPLRQVTNVASRVMYPVYARLLARDQELARMFLATAGGIALFTMPMTLGIMVISGPLILAALGPTWSPAIPVLTILAPVALIHAVGAPGGSVYQAKGRSGALFAWGAITSVITVIAFGIGLSWGIVGVAAAYLLVTAAFAYPMFSIPLSFIGLRVADAWQAVSRPFVIGVAMAFVVWSVMQTLLRPMDSSVQLVVGVAVGALVYATGMWFFDRDRVRRALSIIGSGVRA